MVRCRSEAARLHGDSDLAWLAGALVFERAAADQTFDQTDAAVVEAGLAGALRPRRTLASAAVSIAARRAARFACVCRADRCRLRYGRHGSVAAAGAGRHSLCGREPAGSSLALFTLRAISPGLGRLLEKHRGPARRTRRLRQGPARASRAVL